MVDLSNFVERLSELMSERELNAPALAKELKTDRSSLTRYLSGAHTPNFEIFVKIVEFFRCSADYLLGLTDIPSDEEKLLPVPPFAPQFKKVLGELRVTQYYLVEKTKKFSYNQLQGWLKGNNEPTLPCLIRLAQTLDCSVDYLIGRIK